MKVTISISAMCVGVALCVLVVQPVAKAQTDTILYSFTGSAPDQGYPLAGLIKDDQGNLYGTTAYYAGIGCGTVFMLAPSGEEKVLYSFADGADGCGPSSGALIRDAKGNLYGTAGAGGSNFGATVVFEVTPQGKERVLHTFGSGTDGYDAQGTLIRDQYGNFYGTTFHGGANGAGTIFKLTPKGVETILYNFTGGADGGYPWSGLVRDAQGNFYGTTTYGGLTSCTFGCGVVYELTVGGKEKVLYSFTGGADGEYPLAGLVLDALGNLYGTTSVFGGNGACGMTCGTIFKVTPTGKEETLYAFSKTGGLGPNTRLFRGRGGNLYGVTVEGGSNGAGALFELTSTGTEKTLYNFNDFSSDGSYPNGPLIRDAEGNYYGTTNEGGAYGYGAIFKFTP